MMRISLATVVASTVLLAGCGGASHFVSGTDQGHGNRGRLGGWCRRGPGRSPAGPMKVPDWMKVDRAKKRWPMQIEAGKTEANHNWNFNGFANGDAIIAVPVNYSVRMEGFNNDKAVAHSIGVDQRTGEFPPTLANPQPVFPKAISSKPTDPAGGVSPGKSETVNFKAATRTPAAWCATCRVTRLRACGCDSMSCPILRPGCGALPSRDSGHRREMAPVASYKRWFIDMVAPR